MIQTIYLFTVQIRIRDLSRFQQLIKNYSPIIPLDTKQHFTNSQIWFRSRFNFLICWQPLLMMFSIYNFRFSFPVTICFKEGSVESICLKAVHLLEFFYSLLRADAITKCFQTVDHWQWNLSHSPWIINFGLVSISVCNVWMCLTVKESLLSCTVLELC